MLHILIVYYSACQRHMFVNNNNSTAYSMQYNPTLILPPRYLPPRYLVLSPLLFCCVYVSVCVCLLTHLYSIHLLISTCQVQVHV